MSTIYGEGYVADIIAADTAHQGAVRPSWRCYFCNEVFTTPGAAADHFGATLADQPGCLIDYRVQLEEGGKPQRGRGLEMALRKAQAELARYREEDTDLHREIHRLHSEHQVALQREEEKGYARGLRDGVSLPADSPERATIAGVPARPVPDWHPCRDVDGATCADMGECAAGCVRRAHEPGEVKPSTRSRARIGGVTVGTIGHVAPPGFGRATDALGVASAAGDVKGGA